MKTACPKCGYSYDRSLFESERCVICGYDVINVALRVAFRR